MIALALTGLFAATTLLALGAMAQSWRQYGETALGLRGALQRCTDVQVVSYRIISNDAPGRGPARIIQLPVKQSGRRPLAQPALRAAA